MVDSARSAVQVPADARRVRGADRSGTGLARAARRLVNHQRHIVIARRSSSRSRAPYVADARR